jgi:hypothetical protein
MEDICKTRAVMHRPGSYEMLTQKANFTMHSLPAGNNPVIRLWPLQLTFESQLAPHASLQAVIAIFSSFLDRIFHPCSRFSEAESTFHHSRLPLTELLKWQMAACVQATALSDWLNSPDRCTADYSVSTVSNL